MKDFAPHSLILLASLGGCAHLTTPEGPTIDIYDQNVKLENYYGHRVKVAGFYNREWLIPSSRQRCRKDGDSDKLAYIMLRNGYKIDINKIQFHFVEIEGLLEEARNITTGGDDVAVETNIASTRVIISDAKILMIDNSRTCTGLR